MTTRGPRAGFTLLEVMFATAIFSIVAASLATFFIGVQRLSRRAMATAELSVTMRELREKLLFHAQPAGDGVVRSGLLSGGLRPQANSPFEGGIKVFVDAPVFTVDGAAVSLGVIRLLKESGRFLNEVAADPWRTLWFRFGGSVEGGASSGLCYLGDEVFDERVDSQGRTRIYFLGLGASIGGVEHGERIAVPVFGIEQEKYATSVFQDNPTSTP